MKALVFLAVLAATLSGCSVLKSDVERPVGIGSDRDMFAKSPCACGPAFYRGGSRA